MTTTSLDNDCDDFLGAMRDSHDLLCRFVLARLKEGRHPQDVALELMREAEHARVWCAGRYGPIRH